MSLEVHEYIRTSGKEDDLKGRSREVKDGGVTVGKEGERGDFTSTDRKSGSLGCPTCPWSIKLSIDTLPQIIEGEDSMI